MIIHLLVSCPYKITNDIKWGKKLMWSQDITKWIIYLENRPLNLTKKHAFREKTANFIFDSCHFSDPGYI